ncbi:hypothetical protein SAMN05216548_102158 [Faunimonas pinastri]|uniref:Lysophospholipase n=1 Tax=Faunimonas pinastri TaxID=1855383 RepID=A0A1H9CJC0_9HYPH|nr:DUF1489 family protein [Faunimonas pinastri]SEQ00793.1 hypothetical protein SAMN05216548_102158 [Faunimonas pinastri]
MLHLLKLCVGVDAVEDLQFWIAERLAAQKRAGEVPEQFHTTRMVPKQVSDLLDGGSLYWVIRGNVQVRQQILDVRPFRDTDGVSRCRLVLKPELVATEWQPRRAFQGWRYLKPEEAPLDVGAMGEGGSALPAELRRQLADLGLL